MKKTVLIFAMVALFVISAFGASAANYYPIEDNAGNYSYTVKCDVKALADDATAVVDGESMYGLVAVIGTGEDAEITSATSYVYIDQATVDKTGMVTFTGFLPMGPSPDAVVPETGAVEGEEYFEECTLFIGGPGFDTATELGVLKNASGIPVTGKIVDSFAPAKKATVTVVINAETSVSAETEADGTFAVTVPAGENYSVKVDKESYLTFTYTGVNATTAVELGEIDVKNCAGDVDDNGIIEFPDLQSVLDIYNQASDTATDVDGNGTVEFPDLQSILDSYNDTNADRTSAFVPAQ